MPEQDLTQGNPQGTEENQEPAQQVQAQEPAQQQIDWENEANPYRKRYSDSQSQITPLVRQLSQFADFDHSSRTWRPKQTQVSPKTEDFEKKLEAYDPEFVGALRGYISPLKAEVESLRKEREESAFMAQYNSTMLSSRSKAVEEFGDEFDFAKNGKMNNQSPLYQLANEIVTNKYAVFNPDGTFNRYSTPEAEYLSTVEAYAILVKRSKQQPPDKGKLGAIQGKGTKSSGVKKELSYDEYMKLSDSEKDAYDLAQMGG